MIISIISCLFGRKEEIMNFRMPDYYNKFRCIADKCPDTCCVGWGIVVDDVSMKRYSKLPEADKAYIMSRIDTDESTFIQNDGRCPFLNDKLLCDMHSQYGEAMLCKTCRRYPRHFEEYGDLVEACLSMSCPVAAEMIINNPDKDVFLVKADKRKSVHHKEVDYVLLAGLTGVRQHIFEIINDRSMTINERMARILAYGEAIQKPVYSYEKQKAKFLFPKYKAGFLVGINHLTDMEALHFKKHGVTFSSYDRYNTMKMYMDMLLGLENINEDWPAMINKVKSELYENQGAFEYDRLYKDFLAYMDKQSHEYEHILNYFIYTYFLGGVYDFNILSMIRLAVYLTSIIIEIGMYNWMINDKHFDTANQIKIAYMLSRQVEHSDDNLISLEGLLNAHPLFNNERFFTLFR